MADALIITHRPWSAQNTSNVAARPGWQVARPIRPKGPSFIVGLYYPCGGYPEL